MPEFRTTHSVTRQIALDLIGHASAAGVDAGVQVTVAVVDPSFTLVAYAAADTSRPHAEIVARRKATAAMALNSPSGVLPPEIALELALLTDNVLTNILGGMPLRFDGILVGAVGVTGGTPEQDAAIAASAIAAVGADAI